MRAAVLQQLDGVPEVTDVPDPVRGRGEALVRVTAAALNPLDLLVASGRFYAGEPAIPYVPGSEGIGEVLEGEHLAPGQRVRFQCLAGYEGQGSLAELACAAESTAMVIDEDVSDPVAASLGTAALAGWLAVAWRANLQPGERVLVLGATGAVGQIAVQAAKLLGAGMVVAAARNRDALERIRELGADAVVELNSDDPSELAASFREAAGGELDITIDPLWGIPALAAAQASGTLARLVHVGQSAEPQLDLPSGVVRAKMLSILGYSNLVVGHALLTSTFHRMLRYAAHDELRIHHTVLPLERGDDAWRAQRTSPHSKLVLTP